MHKEGGLQGQSAQTKESPTDDLLLASRARMFGEVGAALANIEKARMVETTRYLELKSIL